MTDLTDAGRQGISDFAARYGLSQGAVEQMARAISAGGGTMAQFDISELGGGGQWMSGGMTMVGDMFNHGLKATVDSLCVELSNAMAQNPFFRVPQTLAGAAWWPADMGHPSAVGGQNQLRYACFPAARRIAVDPGNGAPVVLLDTLDHQIGGFSQQQSGYGDPFGGISFSSQFGQFSLSSLQQPTATEDEAAAPQQAPVPAPKVVPEPVPAVATPPAPTGTQAEITSSALPPRNADDILSTIERLASLRDAGALTEDEFSDKKKDLLARL